MQSNKPGQPTPRKIAFVFPGQGTQAPGMGLALAKAYAPANALLDLASEETATNIPRLLQRGGKKLQETEVQQPAITAVTLGAWMWLQEAGVTPAVVAGHSLGELAAWCAASGIDAVTGVTLASARGQAMASAARAHPGGLLAMPDADEATLDAALALGTAHGLIVIAAYNAPNEWVLSGESAAIHAVASSFATRHIPTSGPWHSPLMHTAHERYLPILKQLSPSPLSATFVSNETGTQVEPSADITRLLASQLCHPIQWRQEVATMHALGVTDYVVFGLVPTLRGLLRKNLPPTTKIHAAATPQELARVARALGAREERPD